MPDRILIVSPDDEARISLSSILREMGFDVHTLPGAEEAAERLAEESAFRLTLFDGGAKAKPRDVARSLAVLSDADPDQPVVVLLEGRKGREKVLEAGASEVLEREPYVTESLDLPMARVIDLVRAVESASRKSEPRNRARTLRVYEEVFRNKYNPVGRSEPFLALMDLAKRLASIPRPVLIVGERGTGKEIVAGAIHFMGSRAREPFVTVNCAAFQGNLLESELFGHEKGAFTGADRRKIGRFEMADGGTLFLDEIGDMSLDFQAKVLRVIEYQEFERLGGAEKLEVDVRVIAATNADLEKKMADGSFREDLYDRLAFQVIHVPPLRDRPDDIEVLAERFACGIAQELGTSPRPFSKQVLKKLRDYPWPGNVRELKNVVERLTCLGGEGEISISEVPPEILARPKSAQTFQEMVDEFQVGLLLEALSRAKGSQKNAAKEMGLTYDQFRHMVRKYDLMERLE